VVDHKQIQLLLFHWRRPHQIPSRPLFVQTPLVHEGQQHAENIHQLFAASSVFFRVVARAIKEFTQKVFGAVTNRGCVVNFRDFAHHDT